MASTRNKNSPGDYKLEKKANDTQSLYTTYTNSSYGIAQTTYFPGDGLGGARVPTTELSENWCDIETQLRGIGMNNLENPKPEVTPDIKSLKSLDVIDRIPLLVPQPLIASTSERPMFLN
jgi:hypothetical protein